MKAQNSSPSLRSLWLSSPPHSTGMEGVLLLGLQCLLPRDQDGSLEADFRGTKKACVLGHALDPWHKHLPSRSVASPPRWLLRAKIKVCTKSPFAVCNGQDNFSWLSFWYWHYYGLFKNTHFVSSDGGSSKECIMTLACMCCKHTWIIFTSHYLVHSLSHFPLLLHSFEFHRLLFFFSLDPT